MGAQVLEPISIPAEMVTGCSAAEPDTTRGEALWVAATNYAIGDEVIRTSTHRVYTALATGVDAGLPESTPGRWLDTRPTNRMAAFDIYRSTAIKSTGTITMTIKPGIVTGMNFFGLVGSTLRVVRKEATTGVPDFDTTYSLDNYLSGDLMWEFYFGMPRQQDSLRINNLAPMDSQIEITLTVAAATGTAEIGIFAIGSFNDMGLPEYGFTSKPIDYSRITTDQYGNVSIIKGLNARNLTGTCFIPSLAAAQAAADVAYRVLGVPCAWIISDADGYDYLNAFGLGTAEITAAGPGHAMLKLDVRGLI